MHTGRKLFGRTMSVMAACLGCGCAGTTWCSRCDQWAHAALSPADAVLPDIGPARRLMRMTKFCGATSCIETLAKLTLDRQALLSCQLRDVALITWVAPAPQRTDWRGHHVPELYARALAKLLNAAAQPLLTRVDSHRQRSRTEHERRDNAARSMAVSSEIVGMTLSGQSGRLLIVDDVRTTGATLSAAASACASIASGQVDVLAATGVARRHPRRG